MAATARRCRSAGMHHRLKPTHSSVTSTNPVRKENCIHRRFGFRPGNSLESGLAMPISMGRT
ncbi:MAG TPA: hypothetical protein PK867_06160, partial [Pirellulales bacterium]|nr:hypothetical protein [Pirellulales bacterium]